MGKKKQTNQNESQDTLHRVRKTIMNIKTTRGHQFEASRGPDTPTLPKTPLTPISSILSPIRGLLADIHDPGTNSVPNVVPIALTDIQPWTDFLTNGEIEEMFQDEDTRDLFCRDMSADRGAVATELRIASDRHPLLGGSVTEKAFEVSWGDTRALLNAINRFLTAEIQEIIYEDAWCIEIGDGDCAQRIDSAAGRVTATKHPDFAAYERQGVKDNKRQFNKANRKHFENRIPGDAKLFRKIRRAMLPPDGPLYRKFHDEAEHVLSQIHDYMDRHGSRYGYIVTDEELIFFRRRGTGWGHMDISPYPAIRHDVQGSVEEGIWNTKAILLYFHFIVANDKEQWHLPSCRKSRQTRKTPDRTAKSKVDIDAARKEAISAPLSPVLHPPQLRGSSVNKPRKLQLPLSEDGT